MKDNALHELAKLNYFKVENKNL